MNRFHLESIPAPITNADAIAPGDLPSWVQAMRPVDTVLPRPSSTPLSSDKKLEVARRVGWSARCASSSSGFFTHQQAKSVFDHDEGKRRTTGACGIVGANPCGRDRTCSHWFLLHAWNFARFTLGARFSSFCGFDGRSIHADTRYSQCLWACRSEISSALNVMQSIPEGAPVLAILIMNPPALEKWKLPQRRFLTR